MVSQKLLEGTGLTPQQASLANATLTGVGGMYSPSLLAGTPKLPAPCPAAPAATGTLTAAEEAEIQAIANRYNTTIDVVGSRAAGQGRNIASDLPVGKALAQPHGATLTSV